MAVQIDEQASDKHMQTYEKDINIFYDFQESGSEARKLLMEEGRFSELLNVRGCSPVPESSKIKCAYSSH